MLYTSLRIRLSRNIKIADLPGGERQIPACPGQVNFMFRLIFRHNDMRNLMSPQIIMITSPAQ